MKAAIETQVCTKCGLEKPLSEYHFRPDQQKHRRDCKDCRSKYQKIYQKAYYKANPEKNKANNKAWREANPEKCRARTAKRKAAKLKATPAWADLKKIEEIYLNCPPGHQVDHYFPLQSPIMCGLHTELNLQYLPAKENISKGNRVSLEQQLNG